MTTALQIINEALEEIGVKEIGQPLPAEEADRGLRILNRVLGTWAQMGLLAPSVTAVQVPMTGAQSYTIGPTGDVVAGRPVKVVSVTASDTGGVDYTVQLLGKTEWDLIPLKAVDGGPPMYAWYDATVPDGRLYVYPQAGSEYTLHVDCQALLASFPTISTDVAMADGYLNALSLAVAIAAAPGYSVPVSADLQRSATAAVRALRRASYQPVNSSHELAAQTEFLIERGY
jgi:hypothetical protein